MYSLDNIMHSRFRPAWVAEFLDPVITFDLFFFKPGLEREKCFPFCLKFFFNKVLSKVSVAYELAVLIGMSRVINFIYSKPL